MNSIARAALLGRSRRAQLRSGQANARPVPSGIAHLKVLFWDMGGLLTINDDQNDIAVSSRVIFLRGFLPA